MENTVLSGDCLDHLDTLPAGSLSLAFADPPYNLGVPYPDYADDRPPTEYLAGLEVRFRAVSRLLTDSAAFWVAIGPEYQAKVFLLLEQLGLHWRQTVIWHYTFGSCQRRKFTPSWTAMHWFTVDPKRFTFNLEAARVPSARQTVYRDKRGHPDGKAPDNVWLLRPQEDARFFQPDMDAWHVPRAAATFKERPGRYPCQMPLAILERIVMACSEAYPLGPRLAGQVGELEGLLDRYRALGAVGAGSIDDALDHRLAMLDVGGTYALMGPGVWSIDGGKPPEAFITGHSVIRTPQIAWLIWSAVRRR